MLPLLFQLQLKKALRSVTLGRKLVKTILLAGAGLFAFFVVGGIGLGLSDILQRITGRANVTPVLNTLLIFFFLLEMMYRYFLQKLSVVQLEQYLHLPVGRTKIIRFLLLRSFLSPYNAVALLLFTPFYWMQVSQFYSPFAALCWLLQILLISWSIHWFMLWYKQKYGDSLLGFLFLLGLFAGVSAIIWSGWVDVRRWLEPLFSAPLRQPVSILASAALFGGGFIFIERFYQKNAYLEALNPIKKRSLFSGSYTLFERFGPAGTMADLELKLMLRHKKSRAYLVISLLFLAYGFVFYTNDFITQGDADSWLTIMVPIIITGMFMMHYGQFFLSWNASYIDFFLAKNGGIEELVKGKYIIIVSVSLVLYLLSLGYIYLWDQVLLLHTAMFLFNIGINIHLVIMLALWEPKPMDLDRSAMFNYEGVGLAQFLLAIPMIGAPYGIYFSAQYLVGSYGAIIVLGLVGVMGVLLSPKILQYHANRIIKKRYQISASFRQET